VLIKSRDDVLDETIAYLFLQAFLASSLLRFVVVDVAVDGTLLHTTAPRSTSQL
jgi:hypothetical protein